MSYRCGIGPGLGLEPGPPRITCDACGFVLYIDGRRGPPKWLLDNRAAPKWTLIRLEGELGIRRLDFCSNHTLETLLAERDEARATARVLAHAYQHDVTPGISFQNAVARAMAYPAIPPRSR